MMPIQPAMTEPNLMRLLGPAVQAATPPANGQAANSPFARLLAAQQPAPQQEGQLGTPQPTVVQQATNETASPDLETAFTDFVGQTFYGQMLHAMRSSLGKPAYVHGGQAEEIFQTQLDQILAKKMSDQTAAQFAKPMFVRQFSSSK